VRGRRASGKLRWRPLASEDRALFCALYTDSETMRFVRRPLSRTAALADFRQTLRATHTSRGPWFFALQAGATPIGLGAIHRIANRAESGLILTSAARGRGYAPHALGSLIDAAFRALPIDLIWVQYHKANAAAARLCDILAFSDADGLRPRGVKPGQRVRVIRRREWQLSPNQPDGGYVMSNVIRFLESAGRDAAVRYATREQLLHAMQHESIDSLIGGRDTMYCALFPVKTPKPKKAPAKKKPAKAPPKKKPAKKKPAKKPAKKKAPAKRGKR
jgi:RimJ/RimL family protein N-acetyltransferase